VDRQAGRLMMQHAEHVQAVMRILSVDVLGIERSPLSTRRPS